MSSRLWIQLFNSLRADLRQDIRRYLAFSMCLEEIAPLSHCMLTQMRSVNNIKYKSSLLGCIPKSINEELPPAFMPCREILLQ